MCGETKDSSGQKNTDPPLNCFLSVRPWQDTLTIELHQTDLTSDSVNVTCV